MEKLVSTVALERAEGGRLNPILQSYFSAPRTPFGSRRKDELQASFPAFLMLSFLLSPSRRRPPPPFVSSSA